MINDDKTFIFLYIENKNSDIIIITALISADKRKLYAEYVSDIQE